MEKYLVNADGSLTKYSDVKEPVEKKALTTAERAKQLIKKDKYATEAHQTQFEKELQKDYGYELTEEFRKELEEKFYSQLDYFYDVFEPQVKSSDPNQGESLTEVDSLIDDVKEEKK